jgi:hypothetical protein
MTSNDDLQKQISALKSALDGLQQSVSQYQKTLSTHQHQPGDGTSTLEGRPDLKAATLSLSGGQILSGSPFVETALTLYDMMNPSTPNNNVSRRAIGEQIVVAKKGLANEEDQALISVGSDVAVIKNQYDFSITGADISQINILHFPNDTGVTTPGGVRTVASPSFFTGFRTPYIANNKETPTGVIVHGGNTLTDNALNLIPNSLVGSRINIYDASELVEGWDIIGNTATVIYIDGGWLYGSGTYLYQVYGPMYLGSADNPWRRLYVANQGSDSGLAIRFGEGPTSKPPTSSGAQSIFGLYYGNGSPNGSVTANPGSFYFNWAGGSGTTFYVKETGVSTNTGWVAYGGGATPVNGLAGGNNAGNVPSGGDFVVGISSVFVNGITFTGTHFVAVTTGDYVISGLVTYSSSSAVGKHFITKIQVNGADVAVAQLTGSTAGDDIGACVTRLVSLNAGDIVQLVTHQDTGGNVQIYNNAAYTYLSLAKS